MKNYASQSMEKTGRVIWDQSSYSDAAVVRFVLHQVILVLPYLEMMLLFLLTFSLLLG